MRLALPRHGAVDAIILALTCGPRLISAGPDCADAGNECAAQGQTCASLTLCQAGGCGAGALVRTWCLGKFEDTPGNIFDTNGAWGGTEFTTMSFSVQPDEDAGNSYVSLFEADYCAGWPVFFAGGDEDAGAYLPGEYSFSPTVVKCIHPYYWADRPVVSGVGIKLVLWPDNDYLPYDQVTCLNDDWVDAGMSGWFGQ